MYSQNNEEELILRYLDAQPGQDSGNFLDIGAYNGKTFSNTLRLVELGWGGLCVEPEYTAFSDLMKLHGENARVQLLNAAITEKSGLLEFWESSGDAVSTLNPAHVERWQSAAKFRKYWVQTTALADLFEKFGHDWDFLNLDVESNNFDLFMAMPFDKLKHLRVICVEHDRMDVQMEAHVAQHGFSRVGYNGENLILHRKLPDA